MPKEQKVSRVELQRRLRIVQEWIIEDQPNCDIEASCVRQFQVSPRQAKRYIAAALDIWKEGNQEKLASKRARRIESLKKMLRSLKPEYKGTPAGMRVVLQIQREIIKLEGVTPTEQMIEAEAAVDKGKQADPLSPTSNTLQIEVLPYGQAQTFTTPTT